MLMAVDFSRTQKGYSVHVFSLYYIVTDLEVGHYFVSRFQNLDYMQPFCSRNPTLYLTASLRCHRQSDVNTDQCDESSGESDFY